MWAPLLLAGFLSGWWGALALAAAPPAIRDTLGATTSSITETRHYRPPSIPVADEYVREITEHRRHSSSDVRPARRDLDKVPSVEPRPVDQEERFSPKRTEHSPEHDARQIHEESSHETDLGASVTSNPTQTVGPAKGTEERAHRAFHPEINESGLTRAPRHSSTQAPFMYPPAVASTAAESSMERPRVARSVKQRPKNRVKADSPREQRRRCRNKERCRSQNWCPDVDVGNRAYLAPTVFEGKVRSMSSLRKPGSNYAVTFEVKQVYKSQPGFQPLQKNDSVRLHFRDQSAPGKSTVCNGQQPQRDNPSGVVRANIKRGKVYLVFVNRVGPRNFTILGPPVIRSKKNEQAVQAVVRPDYGEPSEKLCDTSFPENRSVACR